MDKVLQDAYILTPFSLNIATLSLMLMVECAVFENSVVKNYLGNIFRASNCYFQCQWALSLCFINGDFRVLVELIFLVAELLEARENATSFHHLAMRDEVRASI